MVEGTYCLFRLHRKLLTPSAKLLINMSSEFPKFFLSLIAYRYPSSGSHTCTSLKLASLQRNLQSTNTAGDHHSNSTRIKQGILFQITIGGTNFWGGGKRNGGEGAGRYCWKNTIGGEWGEKEKEKGEKRKQQWEGERRTGNKQADQELGKWGSVGFFSSETGEIPAVNQLVIGINRNTTHFQPFLPFISSTFQYSFPKRNQYPHPTNKSFPSKILQINFDAGCSQRKVADIENVLVLRGRGTWISEEKCFGSTWRLKVRQVFPTQGILILCWTTTLGFESFTGE